MKFLFLLFGCLFFCGNLISKNSTPIDISNANWTATDALGSKLPSYEETDPNHCVVLFYWRVSKRFLRLE